MTRTASLLAAIALTAALALTLVGCGGGVPKDAPGITGKVTDLHLNMDTGGVEISVSGSGPAGKKAVASLTEESKVYGPGGEEARGVDMNKGTEVKVWFDGPTQGSPATGDALVVQIVK